MDPRAPRTGMLSNLAVAITFLASTFFGTTANGQTVNVGNFLNLSVSGDGKTPTALELAGMLTPAVAATETAVAAGASGDVSWSLPLSLPPARHMPEVSLGYSSGGGPSVAGRGFSLDAGITLRRPVGPEARAYLDEPNVIVVSGALDGLLVPDGAGYRWVSERPGAVTATYQAFNSTWTVSSGTTTWTLAARPDVDWVGLGSEPWRWRTISSEDTLGNRADYAWADSRLLSVAYGGTDPASHFLKVVFGYRDAATVFRQPDLGHVDLLSKRLSSIEIQTAYGHASFERRLRYELSYDPTDEYLERIDERWTAQDGTNSPLRLLAAFDYTETPELYEQAVEVPEDLNRTWTFTRTNGTTTSTNRSGLYDVSGDGLVDVVGWSSDAVGRQRFDEAGRWWEDRSVDPPEFSADGVDLDLSITVVVDSDGFGTVDYASYGTRRLVDIDGDGYLDLVRATEEPESYFIANGGTNAGAEAHNREPTASVWHVSYGSPGSLAAPQIDEPAPFRFLSVSHRPHLPEALSGQHAPSYLLQDSEVELADIDGDGWIDVVEWVLGDGMYWYRRVPARNAGWELQGRFALDTVDAPFDSLRESMGIVATEPPDYDYLQDYTQETPTFEYMEARTGLMDVNSDGVVDFVSTRSWTEMVPEWDVWFGTGAGFEASPTPWPAPVPWMSRSEEGAPWVKVYTMTGGGPGNLEDPPVEQDQGERLERPDVVEGTETFGRDQAVLGGLLDIDGDGRADLVVGETDTGQGDDLVGTWHRNTGQGYDLAGTPLPEWFPRATVGPPSAPYTSAVLSLSQTTQEVVVSGAPQSYPPPVDDVQPAVGKNNQWVTVQDINGDGLPDVLDRRVPAAWYSISGVDAYGAPIGTRKGLLSGVTVGTGATSTITWGSSTELWPSGAAEPHQTPIRKSVVRQIELRDPVTGDAVRTDSDYLDGRVVDGRWWGFEEVHREEWSFAPDPGTIGAPSWRWLGETETVQSLSRDAVLPVERRVWTDRARAYAYPAGGLEVPQLRYETLYTYSDHGPGGSPEALWLDHVLRNEWSEDHESMTASPQVRTTEVALEYDAVGNMILQRHTSPGRPQDTLELATDWVGTGALWVPSRMQTRSADPANPSAVRPVEELRFGYDGQAVGAPPVAGLLTSQIACGGTLDALCDPAERQFWSFAHDARGAVTQVLAPGGRARYVDAMAFGSTVAVDESNALDHRVQREIDDLGRVIVETDPNEVSTRTMVDGYGRVVQTARRGQGATGWLVSSESIYHDDDVPRWSKTTHHTYGVGGVPAGEWSERQILDGLGEGVQSWRPNEDQSHYIVVDTERDLRGHPRRRSVPHIIQQFVVDYPGTRDASTEAWWAYDMTGAVVRQSTVTEGLVVTDTPAPGVSRTIDADGWEKRLANDTHGRVVEVRQGRWGAVTVTGRYTHDGRARVTSFADGLGDTWTTAYDGVGRSRQVWRRGHASAVDQPYVGFMWDGPDPVAMIEGDVDTDPVVVTWEHDAVGRPEHKEVWDPVTATWMSYSWSWDTDPSGVNPPWYGVRQQVSDPQGTTRYAYAPDPAVGGFGWLTETERTYAGGQVVSLAMAYDADGREVSKHWPTGAVVDSIYGPTGVVKSQLLEWNGRTASVVYALDDLDRPESWALASEGTSWSQINQYEGATQRIGTMWWQELPANETHTIDYDRMANGWLGQRTLDALSLQYEYDDLGRVSQLSEPGRTLESYDYDVANNLVAMMRDGEGVWSYASAPELNEMPSRSRAGGAVTEDMTWDAVSGRMLSRDTHYPNPAQDVTRSYAYDGAGRLRWSQRAGPSGLGVANLYYDVDDELVFEDRLSGVASWVLRFGGYRSEESAGGALKVMETVLPMARLENGELRVVYLEPEGNAVWTRGRVAAIADTRELLGVYGQELLAYASPVDPVLDGYHGSEMNRSQEVTHFGARHMGLADGAWLQPEPLLHLGMTNGDLGSPLGYLGRYAGGNPVMMQDRSGYQPQAIAVAVAAPAAAVVGPEVAVVTAIAVAIPAQVRLSYNASQYVKSALEPHVGALKTAAVGAFASAASSDSTTTAQPSVTASEGGGEALSDLAGAKARGARTTTNEKEAFGNLEEHHGIDANTASDRLHEIKESTGMGPADNVEFDLTGGVFDPQTGEFLGSLTEGGAGK